MENSKTIVDEKSFGRRSFLKGSAAVLGLAAMSGAGCTPKAALEETQEPTTSALGPDEVITQGVCRGNCGGGCRMNVHVRDGKVVKTSVIHNDNPVLDRICGKGLTHPQRMYAPERIQYPMRRAEGTARGAGEWERITWDEAVDEIATKWKGYIDEFGGNSVGFSFCCGTYGRNYFVWFRLKNCFGGSQWTAEADSGALNIANRTVANYSAPYLSGNYCTDVMNAKNIFYWASNSNTASLGRVAYVHHAMDNGAKIITIDPIFNDVAAKADMWVPIRPGTDGALALAMINIVINEGKAAEDYLMKNTVAPFLVKASDGRFLRMSDLGVTPVDTGTLDMYGQPVMDDPFVVMGADGKHGKLEEIAAPVVKGTFAIEEIAVSTAYQLLIERVAEWTPEKASEITGIPADTILELTHIYLDGPSHLNLGFGNDHWGNGQTITHAQFVLAMVAGQWGISGGGIGGSQGQSASAPMTVENMAGVLYGPHAVFTGITTAYQYLPEVMETGTYANQPFPMKSMIFWVANPLATAPDREAQKKALDALELIIVVDSVMTDTVRYADLVLPSPHWFEFETYNVCPNPYADFNEKAIDPQFECKSDIEIASLIGKAMGYEDMDLTDDSYHQLYFDNDIAKKAGISYQTIKESKHYLYGPDPESYLYGNVDAGTKFFTATGRAEFYIEDVVPNYGYAADLDTRLLALPSFELPIEGWNESVAGYEKNPLADTYPLILITHRDKLKVHTSFALTPQLLEIEPEPTVEINKIDADARGIAEGDYVKLFNDRGHAVMKAHIDASMRPGMMWTEHTWLQQQYVDGHYSSLTSVHTRHHMPTGEWFDTLVQVEKTTVTKGGQQ